MHMFILLRSIKGRKSLDWIHKLQRKFGKFAIPNIITYFLYISVVFYVAALFILGLFDYLILDPNKVFAGEVWRIVTFIFLPITPSFSATSILFAIFGFMFITYIGRSLESVWGSFKMNVYLIISILLALIISFVFKVTIPGSFFIYDSLFLAFAYEFPNNEIRIYFVLPIKIKYLAFIRIAFMVYGLIVGPFTNRLTILLTAAAFLLFYVQEIIYRVKNRSVGQIRKASYQKKMNSSKKDTIHKCEICGMTEKDDPDMEFRYCSKCDGNHEYCANHLFTHTHIK